MVFACTAVDIDMVQICFLKHEYEYVHSSSFQPHRTRKAEKCVKIVFPTMKLTFMEQREEKLVDW